MNEQINISREHRRLFNSLFGKLEKELSLSMIGKQPKEIDRINKMLRDIHLLRWDLKLF